MILFSYVYRQCVSVISLNDVYHYNYNKSLKLVSVFPAFIGV